MSTPAEVFEVTTNQYPCPTCHRKGRVPIVFDGALSYYDPRTGDSWPHEICRTCGGTGWVYK